MRQQSKVESLLFYLLTASLSLCFSVGQIQGSETCTLSISPTNESFEASGGVGSVEIQAASHCNWTAQSNCEWITVESASTGTGPATLSFIVEPCSDPALRTGTLDIAGETFTVTQRNSSLNDVHYLPFYQAKGSDFTGFAICSYSQEATKIQLTAFDPDGDPLPFAENPSIFELPQRGQIAKLGSQIFGVDPTIQQSAWVQLITAKSPVSSFFLLGNTSQLDGAVALKDQSKRLYFTRVFSGPLGFRGTGATTFLSIVNPNDKVITIKATLTTSDPMGSGSQMHALSPEMTTSIPGKGFLFGTVSQLFGLSGSVSSGHVLVEVTEGDGAAGFELIKLDQNTTLMGLNATYGNANTASYSAQLATGASIFTSLKLINTSAENRDLSLTAIASDGIPVTDPVNLQLDPSESFAMDIAQVFDLSKEGLTVGSLNLQADGPGIVGDVLFGDPSQGNYLAALRLQTQTFTEGIFSQVVNLPNFFTGLALYNPATQTAQVSVEVFSTTGERTGWATFEMAAGTRISPLLVQLIPATAGQVGGFIAVRSDVGLVGQSVFGDYGLNLLSAVPPNTNLPLPPLNLSPYAEWENGPSSSPDYFPIGVWLQDPAKAQQYKEMGINTFVALWQGPTQDQLSALEQHGMSAITAQNGVGLTSSRKHLIKGWLQDDEPDNAQSNNQGGYDPCVPPAELVANYDRLKGNDDTRPVLLNFGQGVANIDWVGRGTCTGDTSYYPAASEAADIISFDIYPVTHSDPDIRGKLEFVAQGVANLVEWSGGKKIVWNFIETTHIKDRLVRPTAYQIRTEVWMSLIHGSMGIMYFVHEWEPSFRADAIFRYPEIVKGVGNINAQIASLAPIMNSPTVEDGAQFTSSDPNVPIALMVKKCNDSTYLFAVAMRDAPTTATFTPDGITEGVVEVIDEGRSLNLSNGQFMDSFAGYGVHLYRISESSP